VHPVADAILRGEVTLDLRAVRAHARVGTAEGEDGEVGGGHRHTLSTPNIHAAFMFPWGAVQRPWT
jgi:hypothetical protein